MTLKEGLNTVWKIVLSSLLSAGILLLIYSFTKRDNAEIILQEDVDLKATKVELKEAKTELSKEIKTGDNAVRSEHKTYTDEHSKTEYQQTKLLESMDRKIDILLTDK